MHPGEILVSLISLAMVVGVIAMLSKNPSGANALIASTGSTISNVTKGLEGR